MLAERGHALHAVDLTGDSLAAWVDCVEQVVAQCGSEPVVLVGHSMGGVVAQAAMASLPSSVGRLVLLDSPLIEAGQRAVDVSAPTPPDDSLLPHREFLVPASPVGLDQGFVDAAVAGWANARLRPVPMGPQLDKAPDGTARPAATTIVFFERTPDGFPAGSARRRCEAEGIAHVVADGFHDAPVLDPVGVVELLVA